MVKNLRQLRTKKGISQQKLADVLGITQQTINKYENHAVEPDIYMLTQMADFFETTVDYLVGYTPNHQDGLEQYSLTPEEANLVEDYRILSPKERASIRLVMENYLKK